MSNNELTKRVVTVETTQAGLAVQGAETHAAVRAHTTVVQRVADAVGDLTESIDNSRLFELLPGLASSVDKAAAAAAEAKSAASSAAGAGAAAATGIEEGAERLAAIARGIDALSARTRETSDHARVAIDRIGGIASTTESLGAVLGRLGEVLQASTEAVDAERRARERAQYATNQRLDQIASDVASAKAAAAQAQAAADRTAAAAQAQSDDLAAIRATTESCLTALTAIARGETKAPTPPALALEMEESPGAAAA